MWPTQNPFLGVTKTAGGLEYPVSQVEIENGISAGLHWRAMAHGIVPVYEEHTARLERNIGIADWYEMDPMERAIVVAARRIRMASEAHQADAEIKEARKKSNQRQA